MNTDDYISIAIVLFVLSIICERVADLLKSFLSTTNTGLGGWLGGVFGLGELNIKQSDPDAEQKRSYRILKVNLICGIIVAIGLHADLYSILIIHPDDPMSALGWKDPSEVTTGRRALISDTIALNVFRFIVGCLATAVFISFGSKFWHDALDILLQVKNYRRVLADPQTMKVDNISTLQTLLSTYQSDFIKGAYLEAQGKFMSIDSVKAISVKRDGKGNYFFEISLKEYDSAIPNAYQYLLADGTPVNIPIKIRTVGAADRIVPHSVDLSARVFNLDAPEKWGTIGCLVKPVDNQSTKRYILTCCHNVVHPLSKLPDFSPDEVGASQGDETRSTIGKIFRADRNAFLDGALIEVDPDLIDNRIPNFGRPKNARTLTSADADKVTCGINGAASRDKRPFGTVTSVYSSIEFTYDGENTPFQLNNLLAVSARGVAISERGDSGSVVVDTDNNVLGLVVAGSTQETYIVPIEILLLKYNVQLA